ncbi:hypothetical protein ACSBR1_015409 [Camellia fascicularis]
MKGAPNLEALSAQRRQAPIGLRIRRLYLSNRDIREGRSEFRVFNRPKDVMRRRGSESGDFICPIVTSTKGAPNPEALIGPKTSCADGAPNPETLFSQ